MVKFALLAVIIVDFVKAFDKALKVEEMVACHFRRVNK